LRRRGRTAEPMGCPLSREGGDKESFRVNERFLYSREGRRSFRKAERRSNPVSLSTKKGGKILFRRSLNARRKRKGS